MHAECNVGYAFVNFISVEDLLIFAKSRLGVKWYVVVTSLLRLRLDSILSLRIQEYVFKRKSASDELRKLPVRSL
jgi:hypothetical protein